MTMGDLLARVRVLMTTKDPNQNMIAAVRSSGDGATPLDKSSPNASVTCYRCKCKGHTAKNCWEHGTRYYQCGEDGHWVRDCPGNKAGDKASAPAFSPCKEAPIKNDHHHVATFVIRRSGGDVTKIMTYRRIQNG